MKPIRHIAIQLIVILLLVQNAFSQEEDLIKILTKPAQLSSCEYYSIKITNTITNFYEKDSIEAMLGLWEKECGLSEPMLRLKILNNIQLEKDSQIIIDNYIKNYLDILYNRVSDSRDENYQEIYKNYEEYYSYVSLRGNFDSLTVALAEDIGKQTNLSENERLICILFSFDLDMFESSIEQKKYKNTQVVKSIRQKEYGQDSNEFLYTILLGTWTPLSKQQNIFNTTPQIGVMIGVPFGRINLDLGIMLRLNINDNEFEIIDNSDIVLTDSDIGFFVGGFIAYDLYPESDWKLFPKIGVGYDLIDTDVVKNSSDEDGDEYYSISAVNLSIGIDLMYEIFVKNKIGLDINYHYVPYHYDNNLYTNFSSDYLTVNVIYRF